MSAKSGAYSITSSGTTITVTSSEVIAAHGAVYPQFDYELSAAGETLTGNGAVFHNYNKGAGHCDISFKYTGEGTNNSARPVTVVVDFGTNIVECNDSKVTVSGSVATISASVIYNKYTVGTVGFDLQMPETYTGTPTIISVTTN